jgi:putative DNA methylase
LEALRVGADAFASDLNPVAVLLNKVVLEYIPKYGQRLADEVRKWGQWVKEEAEKELGEFYPKDPDGSTPIAYLWARTIICEGPGCGAEVPLMRSLWLAKKSNRSIALQFIPTTKEGKPHVDFRIIQKQGKVWVDQADPSWTIVKPDLEGTVKRGSGTCPCCGFTTPVASVRKQLKPRKGGANDARLFCVVVTKPGEKGRFYRLPIVQDFVAVERAKIELEKRQKEHQGELSLVPDEPLPPQGALGFRVQLYGMEQWGNLFTQRQLLALTTLGRLVRKVGKRLEDEDDRGLAIGVQSCLALTVDRQADATSSLCRWHLTGEKHTGTFGRQAIPMIWDFSEVFVMSDATGGFLGALKWVHNILELNQAISNSGVIEQSTATQHPLSNDFTQCFFSDPPYYDAVPYSDLSDFFYVWLKRTLPKSLKSTFSNELAPKNEECIVDEVKGKDKAYFEQTMALAMAEGRRILTDNGIGVVVFAHKSTSGWEAQLQAMVDAGWTMTGSWPIDTEMGTRLRARDSAALASSVHLVCRPRTTTEIGDWRDVLQELPQRIQDWMPRLAREGVVGADAIFACLGPALEIFSRYSSVEKANGDIVTLREYLEQVWATVSQVALSMIFDGIDASGLEPDARLTAMWLWTLSTGSPSDTPSEDSEDPDPEDEEEGSSKPAKVSGYSLEYDAARKIAQGLGVHLEKLSTLVAIKGSQAMLLAVGDRTRYLFGKDEVQQAAVPKKTRGKSSTARQLTLTGGEMERLVEEVTTESTWIEGTITSKGETVLDRVHQSMILFATGRSDALKRFLVEGGVGADDRYWRLAQSLSALYPPASQEKRWVDGVLARKKNLGF